MVEPLTLTRTGLGFTQIIQTRCNQGRFCVVEHLASFLSRVEGLESLTADRNVQGLVLECSETIGRREGKAGS